MQAHAQAAEGEIAPSRQRDLLRRAEAARRDFQHYQGRAAGMDTKAQDLLEIIQAELAKLEYRGGASPSAPSYREWGRGLSKKAKIMAQRPYHHRWGNTAG